MRDAWGAPQYFIAQIEDVTEQKAARNKLAHLALHDPLTGLPNRVLALDRIHQAQAASTRDDGYLAVAFLDLDGFKSINDDHGHHVGDDEDEAATRAQSIMQRVRAEVERPMQQRDRALNVRASIGLTLGRSTVEAPEELVRRADAAMYQAKHASPSGPPGTLD